MDKSMQNIDQAAAAGVANADIQDRQDAQASQDVQERVKTSQEKKYTDEDVDRIVAKKIAAERKRAAKALEIDTQESEFEARERKLAKREMLMDAKERLTQDGLPIALSKLMSYDNKDDFEESYKAVIDAFNECVQLGIKDALRGKTPTRGSGYAVDSDSALQKAFSKK